ncbi:unnamed protein product [Rotaria sp. Silwood2]|nr:unnamed protein product [Rotaria sp. Silwood2]CAF4024264.1 unnamed protein product [Rotaria sp. Silwood2]
MTSLDKRGQLIEYYNETYIGCCIVICGTLVDREPSSEASLLMNMIETIGRVTIISLDADGTIYASVTVRDDIRSYDPYNSVHS